MDSRVQRFFEDMRGKRIAFIGIGVSHTELIKLFVRKGLDVTVCDRRTDGQMGTEADELKALGVPFLQGEGYLDSLCSFDVIFRTPGVYFLKPELQRAIEAGRVVTSEMEVFFDLCPCKIIGVTGSDGKTTTTTLISEFLKAQGKTVHLGGNIGRALLPEVEAIGVQDCAVVELSSFQLISMRRSPDVAVVTNVAPNHLDVHGDMQEYIDCKKNLVLHQNAFSRTVLNAENEISASFAPLVRGELLHFSLKEQQRRGAFLSQDGYLCMACEQGVVKLLHRSEIKLPGIHNVDNFLAAISATWGMVDPEVIRRVAREFGGVEHRIELVRTLDGVRWYNDSIASSPTRTIAGLDAFDQKVILIAGGYDKKIPFLPLAPKIVEKVKVLILMGATAPKLEEVLTAFSGYDPAALPIRHAADMAEAVAIARSLACEGDVVTLSPACASFDMYRNFEVRGRHFKELVNAL